MKLIKSTLLGSFCFFMIAPLHGNIFSMLSMNMQNLNASLLKKNENDSQYPELEKFKKKYACADKVQKALDSSVSIKDSALGHNENIKTLTIQKKWYDNILYQNESYFDKGPGIGRIINAHKLRMYLQEQGMNDRFDIADETIYQKGSNFTIISKAIELGNQNQKISLCEIQDMVKIAKDTGYWDWQIGSNLLRGKDGKLIFVDTEDIAFATGVARMQTSSVKERIEELFVYYSKNMNKEAQDWIKFEWLFYWNNDNVSSLLENKSYDNLLGVDVDQVKKEYRKMERRKIPMKVS